MIKVGIITGGWRPAGHAAALRKQLAKIDTAEHALITGPVEAVAAVLPLLTGWGGAVVPGEDRLPAHPRAAWPSQCEGHVGRRRRLRQNKSR